MKVSSGQRTCWFGAPQPPLCATIMLEPLNDDENGHHEMYVQLHSKISTYLQDLGTDGKDVTYTGVESKP